MADIIGKVENVDGTVQVTHVDGTTSILNVGDAVHQGDIINTDATGTIGVVLSDETTFSMGESASLTIDEMVYDPSSGEGSLAMSVTEGIFTFVSGSISKTDPDAMTLNTPVATIGIRGTQVGIKVDENGEAEVALMKESDGFVGEVIISNNGGVLVLNEPHAFVQVVSIDSLPSEALYMTEQEIYDVYGVALDVLPITDNNNANSYGDSVLDAEGLADFETVSDGEEFVDFVTAAGEADTSSGTNSEDINVADGEVIDGEVAIDMQNAGESVDIGIMANGLSDFDVIGNGGIDDPVAVNGVATAEPSAVYTKITPDNFAQIVDNFVNVIVPVSVPTISPPPPPSIVATPPTPEPVVAPTPEPTPEPVTVVTQETTTNTVIDVPVTVTTFVDVVVAKNDLTANQTINTSTRTFTDTTTVDTTVTTTTTPITTITHNNGTIDVIRGTSIVDPVTTTATDVTTRDVVSTDITLPTSVTTYEVVSTDATGAEALISSVDEISIVKQNDLINNREQVDTTTTTTNTYGTDTITTTTTTPVYTLTYPDGTVEVERGTPVIVDAVSSITRGDVLTENVITYNLPTSVVVDEVVTATVSGTPVINTTFIDSSITKNDLDLNKEFITTTRTFTDTTLTDTTLTTTTTPVTTLTYPDGTIEVERGVSVAVDTVTTATDIATRTQATTISADPQIVVSQEVATNTIVSDPVTTTAFVDNAIVKNDLEANLQITTNTRTFTDTTLVDTTVTTTTTPITTITYSDGTIEVERGASVAVPIKTTDVTTSARDVVTVDTVPPTLTTEYRVVSVDAVGTETLLTSVDAVAISKQNDLVNNREQVDTITTTTDTYGTDTTTTTTTTPVHTLTYPDGTTEVYDGTATITSNVATATRDVVSDNTVVTYNLPTSVTVNEVAVDTVVGSPVVTTAVEDITSVKNNLANNTETHTATRNYTDTTTVDTTITTTTTPVTTLTYPDGTVEVERGTPVVDPVITTATTVDTRSDIISSSIEQPQIVITQQVTVDTVVGNEILDSSVDSVNAITTNDYNNNQEVIKTTTTTTDVYSTDTTVTTTTTPVYTITYSDGTIETEYGTPVVAPVITPTTRDVITTDVVTTYADPVSVTENVVSVNTAVSPVDVATTFEDVTNEVPNDNGTATTTVTRNFTDTSTFDTTVTTTTTPVTTVTYSDGTVEIEYGTPTVTPVTTPTINTDIRSTVIDVDTTVLAVDDAATTTEDLSIIISSDMLLNNDIDVDGDSFSVISIGNPTNGTIVDNNDGTWTYTPDANYNGVDSFSYNIQDVNGGLSTAVVSIQVDPQNDDPIAVIDNFAVETVDEVGSLTFTAADLLGNDSDVDGDALTLTSIDDPVNGTLVDNGDGSFTYTPNGDATGTEELTYHIDDGNGGTATGTVNIDITHTVTDDDDKDGDDSDDSKGGDDDRDEKEDDDEKDSDSDDDEKEDGDSSEKSNDDSEDGDEGDIIFDGDQEINFDDEVFSEDDSTSADENDFEVVGKKDDGGDSDNADVDNDVGDGYSSTTSSDDITVDDIN